MEYALYTLIFFLPISKAIIEISASLAILAFIIKKIITRGRLATTSLNKFLFLYVGICGLSIIFSTNIHMSLRVLFTKLLENILIYFILVEVINNRKKIYNVVAILFLSSTLVCIDGFFQYFTHIDFLRHRGWPYSPNPFTLRITGPFVTSNDLAAYLLPLSLLSLVLFSNIYKNRVINRILKVLPLALLICLFLTLSRGAWVGLSIGLLFLARFLKNNKLVTTLILILALFLTSLWFFLPKGKKADLKIRFDFFDPGGRDRIELNKISLRMLEVAPIFGLGLGTYMYNFDRFNLDKKSYPWGASYAHNCYLQIAAETGLFGFLSFLFLLGALFYTSTKQINKAPMSRERNLNLSLLAALFAYLIHSAFDTNLYNLDIGILFWYLLGLSQSQLRLLDSVKAPQIDVNRRKT